MMSSMVFFDSYIIRVFDDWNIFCSSGKVTPDIEKNQGRFAVNCALEKNKKDE